MAQIKLRKVTEIITLMGVAPVKNYYKVVTPEDNNQHYDLIVEEVSK